MLIMLWGIDVRCSWDWGRLLTTAYYYTMTEEIDNPEYFMRYPNNQFWLICVIWIFKVIRRLTSSDSFRVYKAISMMIGVFLTQSTIYGIYASARLIWDEKKAFLVGLLALSYFPFYLYAMFLYTDVAGTFAVSILVYFYIKFCKQQIEKKDIFIV